MEYLVNVFFSFSLLRMFSQLEIKKKLINLNYSFPTINLTYTLWLILRERKQGQEGRKMKRSVKSINFIYFEQAEWGNNYAGKVFSNFTWTCSHHSNTYRF